MDETLKLIITFNVTADAISLEKNFKDQGIDGRLISIPRQLSAGCGLAYQVGEGFEEKAEETIRTLKLNVSKLHRI